MKKIIIILLSVLAFAACKKSSPKPPVNPVLSDRQLLSKSVLTSSGVDTANNITVSYTYDDSNRLVKEVSINKNNGKVSSDTTTYTYDTQGNLITSQFYEYPYGSITDIYYTNGVPDYSNVNSLYKGAVSYTDKITYKVVNGQVTQFLGANYIDHISYKNNNVSGFSQENIEGSFTFTYNTNKGPFYISHFKWVVLIAQTDGSSEYNQNAIVSEYVTASDGFTLNGTYKNTYNAQGYLTKASYSNSTTGPTGGGTDNGGSVSTTAYTYINAK
jgi:uncharacterized protein YcfL